MILVSACLIGKKCRYDGGSFQYEWILDLVKKGIVIPICPEEMGGLSTPRTPSEITSAFGEKRVINKNREDVTSFFIKGAEESLKIALLNNVTHAILKSKSPSCGSGKIYSGNFDGKLVDGDGFTAEILKKHGIKVFNEFEKDSFLKFSK